MEEINERGENLDVEDRSEISGGVKEWRLPCLLYADNLVLCRNSKKEKSFERQCLQSR